MTYKIDVRTRDEGILRAVGTATITDTDTKPPTELHVITVRSWLGKISVGVRAAEKARAWVENYRRGQVDEMTATIEELRRTYHL
mgnify:CR=1 FL=1